MVKPRFPASVAVVILCLAAVAFGSRLPIQDRAAVQESLTGVRPRFGEFVPKVTRVGQNAGLDFGYSQPTISQRL